jgi:hypothetical protein
MVVRTSRMPPVGKAKVAGPAERETAAFELAAAEDR